MQFKTLQGFLAALIAIIAIALALAAGAFFYSLQYQRSFAESQRLIQSLIATVKNAAAIATFAHNPEIGKDVIGGLMNNAVVGRVELKGAPGYLLSDERPGVELGEAIRERIASPFDAKETVGILTVHADAGLVAQQARESAMSLVAWVVGIILVTALLSTLAIQRMVSKPVVDVVHQLREVVPGTPARLALAMHLGRNELGVLVNGFNHLLDAMSQAINDERRLRVQFEEMERRMRQIFVSTPAVILLIDGDGRLLEANPALARTLGREVDELDALRGTDVFSTLFVDPAAIRALLEHAPHGSLQSGDFQIREGLASLVSWVHLEAVVDRQDGKLHTAQCVLYDISLRKTAEQLSHHAAHHDHLTGLRNRRAAEAETELVLKLASSNGAGAAVILIDLDGFKQINDTQGHDAGDAVLVEVAKRLNHSIRQRSDFVARLGGDEFLAVLGGVHDQGNVTMIAQKLITEIGQPIILADGSQVGVGASLGIACFPEHGSSRHALLAAADAAMYETKRAGKNAFRFAAPAVTAEMQTGAPESL